MTLRLLAQDEVVFRSSTNFIAVDAQVLRKEAPVLGLQREDFRVWDNGQPQTIVSFGAEDQPLDVLLMLDLSQSTGAIQQNILASAAQAMRQLLPGDRLGLVIFADQPRVVLPLTLDRQAVQTRLADLPKSRGGTELNEGIQLTAKYLHQHARPGARRAIVMMSDNHGYVNVPDAQVREELWDRNVVFNLLRFKSRSASGAADVRRFAADTGGEVLDFQPTGVPLADLLKRLRQRYYFLYPAPESRPGELHEIRADLSPEAQKRYRGARVRARRGYIAAKPALP